MDKGFHLLLAEDDHNLGKLLKEFLEVKGHNVKWIKDGETALSAVLNESFEIIILDVMMPKMDGFTVATSIREKKILTPIIFLTARGQLEDKVKGYGAGCDDYLTKPFSMDELLLRIQALMKRTHPESENKERNENHFTIGNYTFDYKTRTLSMGEQAKRLTTREADLLKLLCLNIDEVLKREIALRLIWGDDSWFNGRSMDVFITRLRKYLKEDPRIEILNLHGTGFRLIVG